MVDFVNEHIQWTRESYTLSTFKERSKFPIPSIIKITVGTYGKTDNETFHSDEIFIVYKFDSEERDLAQIKEDYAISIPLNCKQKFDVINKDKCDLGNLEYSSLLSSHVIECFTVGAILEVGIADYGEILKVGNSSENTMLITQGSWRTKDERKSRPTHQQNPKECQPPNAKPPMLTPKSAKLKEECLYLEPLKVGLQAFQDIPGDVSSLTLEGVSHCLKLLDLQEYASTFKLAGVDGRWLRTLTVRNLVERFSMPYLDAKKLQIFAAEGLIPKN